MSTLNCYATLAEYKAWKTSPGQTFSSAAADDAVIEDILEAASRYIDAETGRTFYPRVETRYYSVPDKTETNDTRALWLDDDLLSVITLTNGDGTALTTSDYHLLPRNASPKYAVRLKDTSSEVWETDSGGEPDYVISLLGLWGYHARYDLRGWATGSTINEGATFTAGDTTLTVASGAPFAVGDLIKIENELLYVSGVSSNDLTVARGQNGSTAAAHADGTAVTIWRTMEEIRQACLEIAANAYSRRWGANQSGQSVATPEGLIIGPQDVTETARRILGAFRRGV